MPSETDEAVAKKCREMVKHYASTMSSTNIDHPFASLGEFTCVTAETDTTNAKCTYSVKLPPGYRNNPATKVTHGGAIATLFDNVTSMCILACIKEPWRDTGVTRNLNVTYLLAVMEGDEIHVDAEVLQLTKKLATIRGVMRRERDGAVLAVRPPSAVGMLIERLTVLKVCQHDKYNAYQPNSFQPKL
jgi:acyl-coenzyme A thioesterase 13